MKRPQQTELEMFTLEPERSTQPKHEAPANSKQKNEQTKSTKPENQIKKI